ncbi:SUMF1/EgtB/PvdO family nonheme iron enzyme [Pseudactinotalea sp. HY158]|nr:SUMF1/EgtB/PvdO family nonheme iron enzyme [Pseudactinotalea sp. HY158]
MEMVDISAGTFMQGTSGPAREDQPKLDGRGFLDEEPQHEVTISSDFKMSATPITNEQYEKFDPSHAELRGKLGWSTEDDEAAIFVSWHDAVAFTEWLSEEEGVTYRLPTEAEWEYAARAGTESDYWTGEELPEEHWRNQNQSWFPGRMAGHEYGLFVVRGESGPRVVGV